MNYAPRSLRIQMSLIDRKFYHNRDLSVDACLCLINDAVRNALNKPWKPKSRAARPGRKFKTRGRPIV